MLNRTAISSGRYLEHFKDLPTHVRWSPEQIEESLRQTMDSRPGASDFWLFGYGSLIWNPLCRFEVCRRASLTGWHRSFCLRAIAGRATPITPGRMLSLEPGGITQGVAFRLSAGSLDEELRLLWIREMATGAYLPTWTTVRLQDGYRAPTLVFTARPGHPLYEPDTSVATVAPRIATAAGPLGSNSEYLFRLQMSLDERGMSDAYVDALVEAVTSLQSANKPPISETHP